MSTQEPESVARLQELLERLETGAHAARGDGGSRAGGRRPAEPRRAGEGDPGRDRARAPGGRGRISPTSSVSSSTPSSKPALAEELGELEDALRYSLLGGGKRIRPVLCLATGEALGREPAEVLLPACALELVHTFSLVHDDLPALDDDDLRRGGSRARTCASARASRSSRATRCSPRPSASCSATRARSPHGSSRAATLGMIGGQYVDVTTDGDLDADGLVHLHEPEDRAGSSARRHRARSQSRASRRASALRGPPSGGGRPPLPDRRRHPRRHRHRRRARQDAREGRGRRQGHVRLPARARAARELADAARRRERAAGRAAGGHVRPRRARRHHPRPRRKP